MPLEEARQAARRSIGPASLYKEECRDARGAGLSAMLYGVSPRDPATYVVAIALMAVVAFAASWNQAARAVHVDPAQTLRER